MMHIEFRLNYDLYLLSLLIVIIMKAKCGHVAEKSYADAHGGLCRKCHSNFSFLLELEQKYGEDALVEYWYGKILTYPSETKEEVVCFINHLIEFYQQKLVEVPSKKNYIKKMLFMLHSIKEPFDIQTLR
ncbi:MAG: hypothetical protein EHM25_11180 [Nitrosopumilales archaeon]|nr:MAG: hypothetical protein EHM25_11180 [Nitrosopumilales archaeon]